MKIVWIFLVCLAVDQTLSFPTRQFEEKKFEKYLAHARIILDRVPLIDGHNDFPNSLRKYANNQIDDLDIYDLTTLEPWASSPSSHTDINRLRQGKVGAQFWSTYIPCATQYKDAILKTLEQIDVVHRLVEANPSTFEFVTSAQGIEDAFSRGRIGSLVGLEGGHSIGSSLAVLRMMYDMGVRYMTMTHLCNTPWADHSLLDDPGNVPVHDGLTPFGKTVVAEMNRLGMLVDISHVSRKTMRDVLETSTAPVIFSHSSAYALCNDTRNVPDDILQLVTLNGGIVIVNFFTIYVSCGQTATVQQVADHVEHIRTIAGVDHVGLGSDFNGADKTPEGLKDVSEYPNLFAELLARGWTETDLEKVAGWNLLRVLRGAEAVRDQMAVDGLKPFDNWIPQTDLPVESLPCSTGDFSNNTYTSNAM
ncbi:dipeptidase 1-like [Daphnia pulicaria]|uniref:dipeptidase 1-like n=1 Tax=Daphnia pulicaria TaxID=35523 RepID=UPI001EEA561F|nr:dipeptidase 1-like [Daphnia pulicaria]